MSGAHNKKGFGQMASALQRAGIVRSKEDTKLIQDVRTWLLRIATRDEVLPSNTMTVLKQHAQRWQIANRLALEGFLQSIQRGQGRTPHEAGFAATQKLIELVSGTTSVLGPDSLSDDWIALSIWPTKMARASSEPPGHDEPVATQQPPSPADQPPSPADLLRVLADVRAWLARLQAGETVGAIYLTEIISDRYYKQDFAARLRQEGLVERISGRHGGARALPALIELGVPNDAWIIERLASSRASFEQPAAERRESREIRSWHPDRRVPKNPVAREAKAVKDVREWLKQAARGGRMRAGHLTSAVGEAKRYTIATGLVEAGLIVKCGSWYETTTSLTRATVDEMTDEQIAGFIWPSRVALPPDTNDTPTNDEVHVGRQLTDGIAELAAEEQPLDEEVDDEDSARDPIFPLRLSLEERVMLDALAKANGLSRSGVLRQVLRATNNKTSETNEANEIPLSLVAERWGQLLTVLERMDARFARLEQELGLPPIEQST
jgi:hypothetical protein